MNLADPDLQLPADYLPARDGIVAFHFVDEECYPCFPLGSIWNGFDNVAISPQVRDLVVSRWREIEGFDPETIDDLADIRPGADGRICLGWGYATQIAID